MIHKNIFPMAYCNVVVSFMLCMHCTFHQQGHFAKYLLTGIHILPYAVLELWRIYAALWNRRSPLYYYFWQYTQGVVSSPFFSHTRWDLQRQREVQMIQKLKQSQTAAQKLANQSQQKEKQVDHIFPKAELGNGF